MQESNVVMKREFVYELISQFQTGAMRNRHQKLQESLSGSKRVFIVRIGF